MFMKICFSGLRIKKIGQKDHQRKRGNVLKLVPLSTLLKIVISVRCSVWPNGNVLAIARALVNEPRKYYCYRTFIRIGLRKLRTIFAIWVQWIWQRRLGITFVFVNTWSRRSFSNEWWNFSVMKDGKKCSKVGTRRCIRMKPLTIMWLDFHSEKANIVKGQMLEDYKVLCWPFTRAV